MKRIATLISVTLTAACSSQLVGPDGSTQGGTGGDTEVAWLCNLQSGNEITFKDRADAQAHLVGRWILCRPPGLYWAGQQTDQAGIDLDEDMSWHLLHMVGGTLTRADGFQSNGTYRFNAPQDLDYMPANTATLFFGIDYSFVTATMLDGLAKMLWDNGSIYAKPVGLILP
jgi:hypothetical protein